MRCTLSVYFIQFMSAHYRVKSRCSKLLQYGDYQYQIVHLFITNLTEGAT